MTNNYQNRTLDSSAATYALPQTVSVAMGEIAADMQEGLLALAVGAGLQVMQQLMEENVTAACGPKGKHDPNRAAVRHGQENGSVTLGGRRVPVRRPRMRTADGAAELPVPTYELFSQTEILGRMAMGKMLAGISTRRYPVGLEPVGQRAERAATSTSNYANSHSAVSAVSGVALDHGFKTGLYVLTGLLVFGALVAVTLVRSAPAEAAPVDTEAFAFEEAA